MGRTQTSVGDTVECDHWSETLIETYFDHYASLVRLARRHCPSSEHPEDVVQDVFIRFHQGSCAPASSKLLPYLRSMVINRARTAARTHQRHSRAFRGLAAVTMHTSADVEAGLMSEHLAASVQQLPKRQQQTVELRYIAGLSERETAEILGIGAGSVKQHASRARCSLRVALECAS